jgi:phosphate uptake regulator
MVRAREAEAAARAAERREVADRMYERVRREMEAAMKAREEEDQLINLLRQVGPGVGEQEGVT